MTRHSIFGILFGTALLGLNMNSVAAAEEKPTVVLKYEIDPEGYFAGEDVAEDGSVERKLDMDKLAKALQKRLGCAGRVTALDNQQIQVELYGELDQAELDAIKRRIGDGGVLEFRILASKSHASDRPIIDWATRLASSEKIVQIEGKPAAKWVPYSKGAIDEDDEAAVKRLADDAAEALVLIDSINLRGWYISSATKGLNERGAPVVNLSFDREGARRLRLLTEQNKPQPETPHVYRHLGVIFEKKLLSAPRIITAISDLAMISGGSMNERGVEHIVDALNAGSVPLILRVVSEEQVAR